MSDEVKCTFTVGERTLTLSIPRLRPGEASIMKHEWSPDAPAKLSHAEQELYQKFRDMIASEITRDREGLATIVSGNTVVVVEDDMRLLIARATDLLDILG
jgi:hypothetical protein